MAHAYEVFIFFSISGLYLDYVGTIFALLLLPCQIELQELQDLRFLATSYSILKAKNWNVGL